MLHSAVATYRGSLGLLVLGLNLLLLSENLQTKETLQASHRQGCEARRQL